MTKGGNDRYDVEADFAFVEALRKDLKAEVELIEVDADASINDKLFARKAAILLDGLMHKPS